MPRVTCTRCGSSLRSIGVLRRHENNDSCRTRQAMSRTIRDGLVSIGEYHVVLTRAIPELIEHRIALVKDGIPHRHRCVPEWAYVIASFSNLTFSAFTGDAPTVDQREAVLRAVARRPDLQRLISVTLALVRTDLWGRSRQLQRCVAAWEVASVVLSDS